MTLTNILPSSLHLLEMHLAGTQPAQSGLERSQVSSTVAQWSESDP